jgi:chemotaxis-related protein WspB
MTPAYIAGTVNYRGISLPVIDLSQLFEGTNCRNLLSTRIIIIEYEIDSIRGRKNIGLLAEKVNETVKTPKNWAPEPNRDTPYFIDPSIVSQEMVHYFEPKKMLPDDLSQSLFMEHPPSREH